MGLCPKCNGSNFRLVTTTSSPLTFSGYTKESGFILAIDISARNEDETYVQCKDCETKYGFEWTPAGILVKGFNEEEEEDNE